MFSLYYGEVDSDLTMRLGWYGGGGPWRRHPECLFPPRPCRYGCRWTPGAWVCSVSTLAMPVGGPRGALCSPAVRHGVVTIGSPLQSPLGDLGSLRLRPFRLPILFLCTYTNIAMFRCPEMDILASRPALMPQNIHYTLDTAIDAAMCPLVLIWVSYEPDVYLAARIDFLPMLFI